MAFTKADYISEPVQYSDFYGKYLIPNKLCMIGPWLTKDWLSRQKWVDADGSPNKNYLKHEFGGVLCPIANCKQEECGSHVKTEMSFTDFIEYMTNYKDKGYPEEMDCLYLKDWHCVRQFPDYHFYTTPEYFTSDWLNEFWDQRPDNDSDDYRFVYIGPKGTWTPFHSDVFRSYSWSANICGKKKWIFFPPGAEKRLEDINGHLPYDLQSSDFVDNDKKYPHKDEIINRIELIQNEGEVVFVPSGWHHQVFNLEDTISINHNWLNGCNVEICWKFLRKSLDDVQKEIQDCYGMDGWDKQCQLILKSTNGIDYLEFYRFMEFIVRKRIRQLGKEQLIEDKIRNILTVECYNLKYDRKKCRKAYVNDDLINEADLRAAINEVQTVINLNDNFSWNELQDIPEVLIKRSKRLLMYEKTNTITAVVKLVHLCHIVEDEFQKQYTKCHEIYGWHFPELVRIVTDRVLYAQVVILIGSRSNIAEVDLTSILTKDCAEEVKCAAQLSMGIKEFSSERRSECGKLCENVIDVGRYKDQVLKCINNLIKKHTPVLTNIVDELSSAKIIAYAAEDKSCRANGNKETRSAKSPTENHKQQSQNLNCVTTKVDETSKLTGSSLHSENVSSNESTKHFFTKGKDTSRVTDAMTRLKLDSGENVMSSPEEELKLKSKVVPNSESILLGSVSSKHISKKLRVSVDNNGKSIISELDGDSCSIENHLCFDLDKVESVIRMMLSDCSFQGLLNSCADNHDDKDQEYSSEHEFGGLDLFLEPVVLLEHIGYCWKSLGYVC